MRQELLRWISGDDTGISSKAIWQHMTLGGAQEPGHPHDLDDLGRCVRLLQVAPGEWRHRIGEMGAYSAEWRALAEHWDELETLYLEWRALPNTHREGPRWAAWRKGYDRMEELLNHARVCTDCGKRGMSAWTTYRGDVKRCSTCADKHDGKASSRTVTLGKATVSTDQ